MKPQAPTSIAGIDASGPKAPPLSISERPGCGVLTSHVPERARPETRAPNRGPSVKFQAACTPIGNQIRPVRRRKAASINPASMAIARAAAGEAFGFRRCPPPNKRADKIKANLTPKARSRSRNKIARNTNSSIDAVARLWNIWRGQFKPAPIWTWYNPLRISTPDTNPIKQAPAANPAKSSAGAPLSASSDGHRFSPVRTKST